MRITKTMLRVTLDKVTMQILNGDSTTIGDLKIIDEAANNVDLLLMDNEEMENFIFGMQAGVEAYIEAEDTEHE